jgi:hypothetical protein
MAVDVGKFYISFGIDASSFTEEMVRAEAVASGSARNIKDKLASLADSLNALRSEAKQVREQLSTVGNFNVRGSESLDKLHDVLFGVREAGAATDKTLDDLSLRFEDASRGARSYVQALDRIASDKTAAQSVRDLARALSDEAKEANADAAALQKRAAAIESQIASQTKTFGSTLRQAKKQEEPEKHTVPENAAASAFVRGAEGTLSVRAGERFLTSTLGLGGALQSIFPVVGGLAMVDIFTNLIDKTQEWHEKLQQFQDAPKLIASAFQQSNAEFRIGNEELDLMNAKLENDIAVLQGKPRNSLKEAIAEATLEADKLAEALNKDLEALYKLLQENDVSVLARILGNQAGTADIKRLIGGDTGVGGVRDQLATISDEATQKRAAVPVGTTKEAQQTTKAALDSINAEERARTEKVLVDALKAVNAELDKSVSLENKRKAAANRPIPPPDTSGNVLGRAVTNAQTDQQNRVVNSERRIAELRGVRTRLTEELTRSRLTATNIEDRATKSGLEEGKSADSLNEPFRNKINELSGELQKLQASLNAVGQTQTAQILAKGFGDAQAEVARLNNELAKHHQALTLDQQVQILTAYDEIEATKAEESFQQKFTQTTNSITERINSLRTLSAAVGEGYAAQRRATVENQLAQEFSAEYRDPALLRRRQPQIQQRRAQLSTEFDQQQSLQNTQTLDKLSDQVSLENALAAAELQGSEAVRQVTLADRAANLEKDRGVEAGRQLAQSERVLSDAQVRRRTTQAVEQLEQEIAATNNLTAAQSRGAEAVRQAQVENRITEIRRSMPAGPEQDRQIQDVRSRSAAQHQQEIVTNAVQAGNAFKDQLTSLNEQIGYLERIKVSHQGTLETEISLKSLEQQRVDLIARQSLIFGDARDGMRAFFSEMATGTQSAAQQVHDTLGQAFESLNDTLARLVSGQKVSWASFFQGISANLAKMALHNIEAQISAKLFPPANPQQPGQTIPQQGTFGTIRQGIGGLIRGSSQPQPWDEKIHLANPSLTGRTRDGQTPGTALFVTGISSQPSSAAPNLPVIPALPANGQQLSQIPSIVRTSEQTRGVAPGASLGDILTRLPSGLIRRQKRASLNSEDISNLGDFATSELSQLAGLAFGGFRARGGTVSEDQWHIVGEKGPELFIPAADGAIVPNHKLSSFGAIGRESQGTPEIRAHGRIHQIPKVLANNPNKTAPPEPSNFAGFRAVGGDVSGDSTYVVGEQGREIFIPGSKGRVIPNKQLKWLAHLFEDSKHQKRSNPSSVQVPDANAEAEKETVANEVSLAHKTPHAFNRTKTASKLSDVSLANKPAGNQWADVIGFAQLGLKTLSAASSSSGEGGSDTAGDLGSSEAGSAGSSSGLDLNENYNLTRLDSGLILREPKQFADLNAEDQANLGDFQNSELRQLDNSSEGTYPDLGMQQSGGVLSGPSGGSGESNGNGALNLGLLGASVGLGIIQMIMNRPKDHHHKVGHSYSIPNFNGAYAEGGDVKGGMTHLVGEKGPELFVPKADGRIIPHDKLNSFRQFSESGTNQGVSKLAAVSAAKPFAGYRALGGAVDAGSPYVVGEQGSELWTSSSAISDSIAPNGGIGSPSGSGGITIYQDNRGSDPALMEQKTRQGLQAVHKASVRTSFQSWQEYQKRTPQTK